MNASNVVVTKIALAQVLFAEITKAGYDLKGGTQRAEFIARGIAEHSFSPALAATYYQNLSNQANGGELYKYNKPAVKIPSREEVAVMEARLRGAVEMSFGRHLGAADREMKRAVNSCAF